MTGAVYSIDGQKEVIDKMSVDIVESSEPNPKKKVFQHKL